MICVVCVVSHAAGIVMVSFEATPAAASSFPSLGGLGRALVLRLVLHGFLVNSVTDQRVEHPFVFEASHLRVQGRLRPILGLVGFPRLRPLKLEPVFHAVDES